MQFNNKLYITAFFLAALTTVTPSCKKDFSDPSRATDEKLFTSPSGLTGIAVGLQRVYTLTRASSLFNIVSINGLITRELVLLNPGNLPEFQLSQGGINVDGTNTMVAGLWTSSNKIIYDADNVISNAKNLANKEYASGLIAYASIFKALSLGALSMFWENVPAAIGNNVTFVSRNDGYTRAIATIDEALAAIAANPMSPQFLSSIPAGIDIVNTLHALKARYSLFLGNYAQALTSANAVDLTKRSVLTFEASNPNPIYDVAGSNFNVYQAVGPSFGLPATPTDLRPSANDRRINFYTAPSGSPATPFVMKGFASSTSTAFPIYLPGEMTLIKAEAYARQNPPNLANALIELNKIITKKPADDPFGVGADLPPLVGPLTQDQILTEIYRQRSIELYMSGLKIEDMRRFGRPNSERTRNFLPYPFRERDNNPNTPPDPAF